MIPKPEEKHQKPYKEDFFSNFETYHVCDDYAEDIINTLKERDVTFNSFFFCNILSIGFTQNEKLSWETLCFR